MLQIKHLFATIYHPQTDGLVERMNQTLKDLLRKASDAFPHQWNCFLDPLLFALYEAPQFSMGLSQFNLVYGWKPRSLLQNMCNEWAPPEPDPGKSLPEYVNQFHDRLA